MNKKLLSLSLLVGANSFASTSGKQLVWEETSNTLSKSFSGPVALAVGTIVIVFTGFAWAMGSHGEGMGKGLKVAIALGITFGASSIISGLYGFSSSAIMLGTLV